MTPNLIKSRIAELAGKAILLGTRLRQPSIQEHSDHDSPPSAEAVIEARKVADAYARRLLEMADARDALDSAVARSRAAGDIDLASILESDPAADLPDLDGDEAKAVKVQTRLKAYRDLVSRGAESAAVAVLTMRRAAAFNVTTATAAARAAVLRQLPSQLFNEIDLEQIFKLSKLSSECEAATEALSSVVEIIPLTNAEFFGKQLPSPYRIDALPIKGDMVRDAFDPRLIAERISHVLEIHMNTVIFVAGMSSDPSSTRWKN